MCELEEHSHSETCYVPFVERSWMEPRACSLGGHTHDDVCTAEGCEQFERIGDVDIIVHTHDDLCYDVDGSLVCDLEELELHRHTAACYRISSEQEDSDNALVEDASEPETSNQEDHVREDTIQEDTIQEDSGSAERGSSEASSGEDVIVEEDDGEEERGSVMEEEPVAEEEPAAEEDPVADEEPAAEEEPIADEEPSEPQYSDEPQCGMEELEFHTHSEACLDESGEIVCGELQVISHEHDEQCLQTVYSEPDLVKLECGEEEGEAHVHDENCYSYWMLDCGMREHIHDEDCGILFEANLELENEAMLLKLKVLDPQRLPEDLSFELRELERSAEKYASYADYALENTPGELRTLSAYEIVFFSNGEEIELPDAEITAELTVKELDIPEAAEIVPLTSEEPVIEESEVPAEEAQEEDVSDAGDVEEIPDEEEAIPVQSEEPVPAMLMMSRARMTTMLAAAPEQEEVPEETSEQEESIEQEEDDTAYQMHLTVLSSDPGGVSDEDSATVESPEEDAPVMFMVLGSRRTFALARSVEPLPRFEIHYLCNMLRYYTPSDDSRVLNVINTARTDGSYPVQGEPLGGILPINGRGSGTSPTIGNEIYELYLEPSSTHDGYFRTAMTYQLVEVYQAHENVIYSNAMTSRHMNVLRDNDHYGVTYIQVLPYEPTSDADWDSAAVYDVNWDSTDTFWDNVNVVSTPDYVWKDVDALYYFTNNPDAVADEDGREPIIVTDGMVMRYIYFPTSRDVKFDASFFDYDISNGNHTTSGNVITMYTGKKGINSEANYTNGNGSGSAELAFGNSNTGSGRYSETMDGYYINQYNSSSYKGLTFGIVTGYDPESGKLTYNSQIKAPYLFNYQPNGSVVGKSSYSNTDMVFRRDGDTYTLTRVEGTDGIQDMDLELFEITYTYDDGSHLYSNSFWPFDEINDGGGHDIHFGSAHAHNNNLEKYSGLQGNGTTTKTGTLPGGDEGDEHNSYFGVEYAVDFHLDGSYTGPLEYLFYGDDDMWVFLTDHQTGQTKLIADIGGVHSSVGSYTDLWDWVPNTDERPNGKGDYTLTFFYTERGASGSSCFMQFTIPDAVGVPMQTEEVGSVEVEKLLAAGMTTDEDFRFTYDIEYPSSLSEVDRDRILPYTIYEGSSKVVSGALFRAGEFELKAGQRIIIGNIPVDSKFSVSENITTDSRYEFEWVYSSEVGAINGDTVSGTITAPGQTIEFDCINTYNSLTLTKRVEADPGFTVPDTFTFDVLLTDANGAIITDSVNTVIRAANGDYGTPTAVTPNAGKITVTLQEDESVSIYPLPDGAKYTITEQNTGGMIVSFAPDDDLTAEQDGASYSGTVPSGNEGVTCFNRAYYVLPSTGGPGTTLYTMGGLLLMAAAVLLGYKKVRKEECSS